MFMANSSHNRQPICGSVSGDGSASVFSFAEKPVFSMMAAMSCTDALSVSNTTCASSLAKFTPASATKSFLFNTFSMREAQA